MLTTSPRSTPRKPSRKASRKSLSPSASPSSSSSSSFTSSCKAGAPRSFHFWPCPFHWLAHSSSSRSSDFPSIHFLYSAWSSPLASSWMTRSSSSRRSNATSKTASLPKPPLLRQWKKFPALSSASLLYSPRFLSRPPSSRASQADSINSSPSRLLSPSHSPLSTP